MNSDFKDLLQSLHACDVRYLVAGGYAVIHHSQPRYTKDIDLWIEPTPGNARKLMQAFRLFGIPLIDISEQDFATPGAQFTLGVPPCAIDFLTTIPGLDFDQAWLGKARETLDNAQMRYFIVHLHRLLDPSTQKAD